MRTPRVSLILMIALFFALVSLSAPTPKARAGFYETTYTVRWISGCIIWHQHPYPGGTIVGEWTVDCFNNWSGWGPRPGENPCTYTETYYGNECLLE
jgi:hypothetical protein